MRATDKLVEVGEPLGEPGPGIGDECEQESGASGSEQALAGLVELVLGDIILLEVDPGEPIDLEVEEGGGEEWQEMWLAGFKRLDFRNQAVLMVDCDGLAGLVVASGERLDWGFHAFEGGFWWGRRQRLKSGRWCVGFARPWGGAVLVWWPPDLPG